MGLVVSVDGGGVFGGGGILIDEPPIPVPPVFPVGVRRVVPDIVKKVVGCSERNPPLIDDLIRSSGVLSKDAMVDLSSSDVPRLCSGRSCSSLGSSCRSLSYKIGSVMLFIPYSTGVVGNPIFRYLFWIISQSFVPCSESGREILARVSSHLFTASLLKPMRLRWLGMIAVSNRFDELLAEQSK